VAYRSSNKMPAAVKEAIEFAAEKHGGLSVEEAKEYLHSVTKQGRLIEECWS
jgi:sulfite reductase alpha subunit-like flavoprotein